MKYPFLFVCFLFLPTALYGAPPEDEIERSLSSLPPLSHNDLPHLEKAIKTLSAEHRELLNEELQHVPEGSSPYIVLLGKMHSLQVVQRKQNTESYQKDLRRLKRNNNIYFAWNACVASLCIITLVLDYYTC